MQTLDGHPVRGIWRRTSTPLSQLDAADPAQPDGALGNSDRQQHRAIGLQDGAVPLDLVTISLERDTHRSSTVLVRECDPHGCHDNHAERLFIPAQSSAKNGPLGLCPGCP